MAEIDRPTAGNPRHGTGALEQLAESARGWHRIQLAVLGFIGFCGVFWDGAGSASPAAVRWLAAALVAAAFVLANLAIFMVGRVAHPVHALSDSATTADGTVIDRRTRRLRTGIRLTYLAVALLVAATLSSWLPTSPADGGVLVADATGQGWCGQLVEAPAGEVRLSTADGPVGIPLNSVTLIRPQAGC